MQVVPRTPTPMAQASFPGLIDTAFQLNLTPLRGIQRMMLAVLAAIETGRGASVQNFNIGNISAGPSYAGAVWRPPWFDPAEAAASPKLQRLHQEMLANRAPQAFRAYANATEGALDFARVLTKNFPEVLKAALVPNANAFREALAQKYSKDYANPKHTAAFAQLMKEYGIKETSGMGALVLVGLAFLAWRLLR